MAKGSLDVYEAQTRLSELVDKASKGQTFVIAKNGKPSARLMPLARKKPPRKPGAGKGKVWIAEDFDTPLPEDVLGAFEAHEKRACYST